MIIFILCFFDFFYFIKFFKKYDNEGGKFLIFSGGIFLLFSQYINNCSNGNNNNSKFID